jgi:hypothetical protein
LVSESSHPQGLIEAADDTQLTGTVEVAETYMASKKYDKRGKYEKEPVFGIFLLGDRRAGDRDIFAVQRTYRLY